MLRLSFPAALRRTLVRGSAVAALAGGLVIGVTPAAHAADNLVCTGGGTEHSFARRRLGLSVECPICGQFALSVDLAADFYRRWAGGARDHPGRKRPKMSVFPLPRQRRWQPRQGREALVPTG